MKVKKILKIIGIILLIVIAILLIHSVKNFIIIKKMQENFSKYETSTNYHIKSIAKENENTTMVINYYKKGDKQVTFMERTLNQETLKVAMYDNGTSVDVFTDNGIEKTYRKNAGSSTTSMEVVNYFHTDNDWQTFILGAFARIKEEKCNQKDCYFVINYLSPDILYEEGKNDLYIEKDTGLCIKSITGQRCIEREYEFENVDDSIFVEPDISGYRKSEV